MPQPAPSMGRGTLHQRPGRDVRRCLDAHDHRGQWMELGRRKHQIQATHSILALPLFMEIFEML